MIGRVVVVACLLLLLVCRTGICAQIASISRYSNFRNEDFKIYTPEGVSTVFEEALSLIQAHFYRASEFDDAFWAEMIRRFGPLANTHEVRQYNTIQFKNKNSVADGVMIDILQTIL